MSTMTQELPRLELPRETANDRFKRGSSSWTWIGLMVATAVHFGIFVYTPEMKSEDMSFATSEISAVEIPPQIDIPSPPQPITRPATPVVSATPISEDITIAPTTFEHHTIETMPPPPMPTATNELATFKAFTPEMVAPRLRNTSEIARALEQHYPPLLRDAGIGGTVYVLFWIDESGKVVKYEVSQSSGYPAFDEAAGKVADLMRFSPAMNRDQPVRVVVSMPITFRTNN